MPLSDMSYPRPPLALIVTGQEWTWLSFSTIFSPRGYATLRVLTGAQALERVRETAVDLVLVDRRLRDMEGPALVARLREDGHTAPVLIMSGEAWERHDKLAALQAGAWDVCALPMDGEELFLRVDTWVRSKLDGDVSSRKGLLDPETGLYNVQGLPRRIMELGAAASRYRRPMACVVVAAQPTSAAGEPDRRLQATAAGALAAVLRQTGRASDTIGRLSDTEFVIMAPDTDQDGVRGLAERLRGTAEVAALMESSRLAVRFGCYAVPDMREASIAPSELLIRAAEALRRDVLVADSPIRFFDGVAPRAN
jgi:PleD family two-component response regulator